MIWTYLFCLVAGGILIAFSIAGDADSDVSGDGEGVANGGHASRFLAHHFGRSRWRALAFVAFFWRLLTAFSRLCRRLPLP